ncbi:MAG: PilZ domain-containing protein [Candidatus Thiodiazotropha endolucinida]
MDARRSPRTKTSLQVMLASKAGGVEQVSIVRDLSETGFYATSLATAKVNDGYRVSIKRPGHHESQELSAKVIRVDNPGCGLAFDQLTPHESQFLTDLIHPKWDGKDLLEGVIMHGILEDTASFAACMRLTSLLDSNYKHGNRAV